MSRSRHWSRERAYAREQAPGPGVANWIGAVAFDEQQIVYLGDGRYIIGHLYEIGGSKRSNGDSIHYPIIFNPSTACLQVKLPRACVQKERTERTAAHIHIPQRIVTECGSIDEIAVACEVSAKLVELLFDR